LDNDSSTGGTATTQNNMKVTITDDNGNTMEWQVTAKNICDTLATVLTHETQDTLQGFEVKFGPKYGEIVPATPHAH
jgi:hypothetical protein